MALAGHGTTLRIRTTSGLGSASDNVDGASSVALNRTREQLETSDFESGGDKNFIMGLRGAEIPISGDYESGNAPQALLETHFESGVSLWAVILWDGTAGKSVECLVSAFNVESAVADKVTFSATLVGTGAVAAAV